MQWSKVYTLMHEIELKPSLRLGMLLLAMVLLAGLAIYLAALPPALKWALATANGILLGWTLVRQRAAMPRLRISADGSLGIRMPSGEWVAAGVIGDSYVSAGLCVLRMEIEGKRRVLTLLPDSVTPDGMRRLRASLRWGPRTRSDTASRDAG